MVIILVALWKGGGKLGSVSTSSVQPWDQDVLLPCENLYSDVASVGMEEFVLWLRKYIILSTLLPSTVAVTVPKIAELYVKLPVCAIPLRR